ncbi:MAG TPA: hypothetical protein VF598_00510 [Hymenobacter sp.]|jgi:hypothetical protein
MKKITLFFAVFALSTAAFAQGEVKTDVKTSADGTKKASRTVRNEATGAKTTTETKTAPDGREVTSTEHKTGRTKVGQKIHKAHMKVKKAV